MSDILATHWITRAVEASRRRGLHSGSACTRCQGSHTALVRGRLELAACPGVPALEWRPWA